MTAPIHICGLTEAELVTAARARLTRGYGVARALYRQVVREARFDPEALGLSASTSDDWRDRFRLELPQVARRQRESQAQQTTAKRVLRLHDGYESESVYLPMGRGRSTLCISSQVGCKMGCAFCETGRMGLLRNLSAAEIISQLLVARHREGLAFRNVVFMGMGEALDNVDQVLQALRVMTDPGGMAMAQERITVCTVGRIAGIARLKEAGLRRLNLSVSLNATTDSQRAELMPSHRTSSLQELQQALIAYRPRDNFALGVNYCLLPGMNDSAEDAERIAQFCNPLGRVMVNLIPYNPGTAPLCRAPQEEEVVRFVGLLRQQGLPVRRRITKGRDVMAACGQLGNLTLLRNRDGGQRRNAQRRTE